MDVPNPRRILVIGAPGAGVLDLLKDLTGSAPTPLDTTTAGLTHTWAIKTPYYTATVPIWIDEVPSLAAWQTEFLKPEAREVITALGAWIFCFRRPLMDAPKDTAENLQTIKDTMRAVQEIVEKACGYAWDGACLAIAMPQSTVPYLDKEPDEWEDVCREFGFEYVDAEANGKNEFGERVGVERLKEALEANEWDGGDGGLDELGLEDDGEGGFNATFDAEEVEMNMELFGVKTALNGAKEEDDNEEALQVEELEKMMGKMQAVKDMSAGMPEEQRKKFAAKAVNDLMKSFD